MEGDDRLLLVLVHVTLASNIVYLTDTVLDLYLGYIWHELCLNDIWDVFQ